MEKKKIVGFRLSYMENDPRYNEEVAGSPSALSGDVPAELAMLRRKIGEMALFMSSSRFARMNKSQRLEFVLEFAELNSIENGYARAVEFAAQPAQVGVAGRVEIEE